MLEQLCRYITHPAIVNERLRVNPTGQVVLKLKTPYRDSTSHLLMSPLKFMQRLAPGERWCIAPYVDFAGAQGRLSPRDQEDPRIDPAGTAAWATVNPLVSWQVMDTLRLGLKLTNLGDRNYREHGSGIDAPATNLGAWVDIAF